MHSWTAGDVLFSPTSFYAYIECPLNSVSAVLNGSGPRRSPRRSICRCSGRSCLSDGTALHAAVEYSGTGRQIRALIGSAAVADAVTRAVRGSTCVIRRLAAAEYGGNVFMLVRDIVHTLYRSLHPAYDAAHQAFGSKVWNSRSRPRSSSVWVVKHIQGPLRSTRRPKPASLTDGRVRVVDYKGRSAENRIPGSRRAFSADSRRRNAAACRYYFLFDDGKPHDRQ